MTAYNKDIDQSGIAPYLSLTDVGWKILEGDPRQSIRVDHGAPDADHMVGLWRCTPGTFEVPSAPQNELMTIISGHVAVGLDDEAPMELVQGESVYIQKGQKVYFDIKETITKYFMATGFDLAR